MNFWEKIIELAVDKVVRLLEQKNPKATAFLFSDVMQARVALFFELYFKGVEKYEEDESTD